MASQLSLQILKSHGPDTTVVVHWDRQLTRRGMYKLIPYTLILEAKIVALCDWIMENLATHIHHEILPSTARVAESEKAPHDISTCSNPRQLTEACFISIRDNLKFSFTWDTRELNPPNRVFSSRNPRFRLSRTKSAPYNTCH